MEIFISLFRLKSRQSMSNVITKDKLAIVNFE